jgi:hypothetical protein
MNLVDYLQTESISVVLLKMPELGALRPLNLPDPESNFRTYADLVDTTGTSKSVQVLDANVLPWTLDDYADPHHLNVAGATKLSEWLATELDKCLATGTC